MQIGIICCQSESFQLGRRDYSRRQGALAVKIIKNRIFNGKENYFRILFETYQIKPGCFGRVIVLVVSFYGK